MTSLRSLSKNFLIQTLGKTASIVIGLLFVAILARSLGQEGYGEYTTAVTFLQFFGVIVDFGLTLTLVVLISKAGADEAKIVGNVLTMRLITSAILFTIAPLAVLPFAWSATIKLGVAVGALAYFLMSGANVLIGIFQKHESMW